MNVIDFHSHILPGIDDGSRSPEMSAKMLELSARQGITIMIATPHFYADRMPLRRFLEKRAASCDLVGPVSENYGIRLIEGAETSFFFGMSNAEDLKKLTIADTSLLLLEMPFCPWKDTHIQEVKRLVDRGLTPVMAHIERFYPYQKDKRIFDELYALPILVQVNAQALLSRRSRRLSLKLFQDGNAHLLGSDCHNTLFRPPNLASGREMIAKKLGSQYLTKIDRLGGEALKLNIRGMAAPDIDFHENSGYWTEPVYGK